MPRSCSWPSQHGCEFSGLLLLPLGTVRPLDRTIRKNEADRVPGRGAAHCDVAGQLAVGERPLIVLEIKVRSVLRDRHRLSRPRTRRGLRLAAIRARKIHPAPCWACVCAEPERVDAPSATMKARPIELFSMD